MRKIFFTWVFLLVQIITFAAARFWVGGGSSANWSATGPTNWSATSGGAGNATVPGSSDDVTFDGAGASGNSNSTISAGITVLSLSFTTGYTQTVTINTGVQLTISGNFTDRTQHSWTVNGTGNLNINATSTITSNGKTFPGPVTLSTSSTTKTLSGDWTISGTLTLSGSNTVNSGNLNIGGGLTGAGSSVGTTVYVLNGTGSWNPSGGTMANSITINTAGTITIGGTVNYLTGTLTYTAGTVVVSGGGTFTISGSCTLSTTSAIQFDAVSITAATSTITLNALFTANSLSHGAGSSVTYAGTSGWTVGTFTLLATSQKTVTLVNGVTYTITSSFQAWQTGAAPGTTNIITSDHATIKAILTLQAGALCSVVANFTRIDASAGRTINTFHGTLTSTTNIFSYTDYGGGVSSSHLFVQ